SGDFCFPAIARARTFFGHTQNSFLLGKIEVGFQLLTIDHGVVTQGGVHRRRIDNLIGIEYTTGVKNVFGFLRSEERRVGKECRSRWAAYNEEKKETRGEPK